MPKNDERKSVRCSFCGKHQEQVARIIAGPGAYICNECVHLCMSILDDTYDPEEQAGPDSTAFRAALVSVAPRGT